MTLTREEILAMEPGEKLDHAVIESVLKWHKVDLRPKGNGWFWSDGHNHLGWDSFSPSTNISAAWEVVESMKSKRYGFAVNDVRNMSRQYLEGTSSIGDYHAMFRNEIEIFDATEKTAPEAICKAALFAVLNL